MKESEKRQISFRFSLTKNEKELFEREAKKRGNSLAGFLRNSVIRTIAAENNIYEGINENYQ